MFFDSNEVDDLEFEIVSKGEHAFTIVGTEVAPTKNGNGTILSLKLQLDSNSDLSVIDRFNIKHINPQTERIGRFELKRLCQMVGKDQLARPEDLIGSKVLGIVVHKEYNGNTYANIEKYRKYTGTDGVLDESTTTRHEMPF